MTQPVDENFIAKLQKILALTESPVEGEAQAAAAMLAKLLESRNMTIADLERKGQKAPATREERHDLGKAAFTWKLDLAEAIANHYYCIPLVNRRSKTVAFIGRPENVESLQMLYQWLIDQIRRIASEERRKESTHIDPLRWQLNFGVGAVARLKDRLQEIREARAADVNSMAIVVHHDSENSDYLEEKYGYRVDGQKTKEQVRREEAWAASEAKRNALRAECEANGDMEPYYAAYPWERPKTDEQIAADMKRWAAEDKRWERNARRRVGRAPKVMTSDDWKKIEQAGVAHAAGRAAADRVALDPFLNPGQGTGNLK